MRVNPLKTARRARGLTQATVAERAKISPLAVLRYEQGLFERPSLKIVEVLELDVPTISLDYQTWREEKRNESRGIKWFVPLLKTNNPPFEQWAYEAELADSKIGICKALCLHPQVLVNYMDGKTKHLPPDLVDALLDIGWDSKTIDMMHETHRDHFRALRNRVRRVA